MKIGKNRKACIATIGVPKPPIVTPFAEYNALYALFATPFFQYNALYALFATPFFQYNVPSSVKVGHSRHFNALCASALTLNWPKTKS